MGAKQSSDSYRAIAQAIARAPGEILFLSDVAAELDAARSAGLQTTQLCRDGALPASAHPLAASFDQLDHLVIPS